MKCKAKHVAIAMVVSAGGLWLGLLGTSHGLVYASEVVKLAYFSPVLLCFYSNGLGFARTIQLYAPTHDVGARVCPLLSPLS
jgi:hypothetical protein